jgi:hypothetical protein
MKRGLLAPAFSTDTSKIKTTIGIEVWRAEFHSNLTIRINAPPIQSGGEVMLQKSLHALIAEDYLRGGKERSMP